MEELIAPRNVINGGGSDLAPNLTLRNESRIKSRQHMKRRLIIFLNMKTNSESSKKTN